MKNYFAEKIIFDKIVILILTHNLCFEQKYQTFSAETFQFLQH